MCENMGTTYTHHPPDWRSSSICTGLLTALGQVPAPGEQGDPVPEGQLASAWVPVPGHHLLLGRLPSAASGTVQATGGGPLRPKSVWWGVLTDPVAGGDEAEQGRLSMEGPGASVSQACPSALGKEG